MAEHVTPSGLAVIHRASETIPNSNDPADVPPATVGANVARPGDPHGLLIEPSPWSGWPSEWATPYWDGYGTSSLEGLVDMAWFCLDKNASILASMPPYLVGAAPTLPASWLTNPSPDHYNSWHEFAKELAWDFQLGEVFVLATARYNNGTGWPARFHVIEPWKVNVELGSDGLRHYTIGGAAVSRDDLLHIRYKTTSGSARGTGPLEAGRSRLVAAATLARYASTFAAGGGVPYYALTHEEELDAQQAADLLAAWWQSRTSKLGQPAVLGGGIQIQPLQVNPKDMALVELSMWFETHIATALGVPAALVNLPSNGDSLTYSTALMAREQHWQDGLKPKADALMQALSGWLLPYGTSIEVNRDEYVRPGMLERAQAYATLIPLGIMSALDAAEIERFTNAGPTPVLTSGVLA